eukprot:TRINITY_DN35748_c0_g1_i1.p1 TRINITY_DN35748_c0_g1~~TRINITY_DN35748_c0_g1_i1.p1  ORF type:complete len:467 (-),score=198.27 TRINITY_DN35748_c0_g1_i1:76-1476(-)
MQRKKRGRTSDDLAVVRMDQADLHPSAWHSVLEELSTLYARIKPAYRDFVRSRIQQREYPLERYPLAVRLRPVSSAKRAVEFEFVSFGLAQQDGGRKHSVVRDTAYPTVGEHASPSGLGLTRFAKQTLLRHGRLMRPSHIDTIVGAIAAEDECKQAVIVNVNLMGPTEVGFVQLHERTLRESKHADRFIDFNMPVRTSDEQVSRLRRVSYEERNRGATRLLVRAIAEQMMAESKAAAQRMLQERDWASLVSLVEREQCQVKVDRWRRVLEALHVFMTFRKAHSWSDSPAWGYNIIVLLHVLREAGLRNVTINCKSGHDRTAIFFSIGCALNALHEAGYSADEVHAMVLRWNDTAWRESSSAGDVVLDFRKFFTQAMLSVGLTVTFWNTGVPGLKYGNGRLQPWLKRTFHANTAALPFVSLSVDLHTGDRSQAERVDIVHVYADEYRRQWSPLGEILFDGLANLRSS